MQVTVAPAGIVTPCISTSSAGWRMIICTGGEWRSVSANAASISDRSARTAASWSGLAIRFMNMFDERLVGRLPAGDQQQRHERLDLAVRHLLAVDRRRAQRAQQVGTGVGPAFGDDRQHVGLELVLGLQPVGGDRGVTGQVAEEGHDRVVPPLEAGVVGLVEAEHVDDHVDRELDRELPDEVDAALVAPRVDEVASVAGDDRHELLGELAAAERRLDEVAVHRVLATVHLQDRAAVHRLELPGVVVRRERLVLERPLHVVVARDHPRLHRLVEEDRMLLAHRLHQRVGVSCELR